MLVTTAPRSDNSKCLPLHHRLFTALPQAIVTIAPQTGNTSSVAVYQCTWGWSVVTAATPQDRYHSKKCKRNLVNKLLLLLLFSKNVLLLWCLTAARIGFKYTRTKNRQYRGHWWQNDARSPSHNYSNLDSRIKTFLSFSNFLFWIFYLYIYCYTV